MGQTLWKPCNREWANLIWICPPQSPSESALFCHPLRRKTWTRTIASSSQALASITVRTCKILSRKRTICCKRSKSKFKSERKKWRNWLKAGSCRIENPKRRRMRRKKHRVIRSKERRSRVRETEICSGAWSRKLIRGSWWRRLSAITKLWRRRNSTPTFTKISSGKLFITVLASRLTYTSKNICFCSRCLLKSAPSSCSSYARKVSCQWATPWKWTILASKTL